MAVAVAGALQMLRGVLLQRVGDWLHTELSAAVLPTMLTVAAQSGGKGNQGMRDVGGLPIIFC